MKKIGFIGTGHMTRALVRFLAPQGHQISVTHRNPNTSEQLVSAFRNVTAAEAEDVVAASDLVFLCLRPDIALEVLRTLPFRKGQHVISVMAGISTDALRDVCKNVDQITLLLPMELVEKGGCPLPIWPENAEVRDLFEPENTVIALPSENSLSACFAATTLVSAVAETLDVGTHWLGNEIGPDAAQTYIGMMLPGMLAIHADQEHRFGALRDSLATPNTLNLSMVETLRNADLPQILRSALDDLT